MWNIEWWILEVGMLNSCAKLQWWTINQPSLLEINELPDLVADPFIKNGVSAIVWFLSKKITVGQAILSWRHALRYVQILDQTMVSTYVSERRFDRALRPCSRLRLCVYEFVLRSLNVELATILPPPISWLSQHEGFAALQQVRAPIYVLYMYIHMYNTDNEDGISFQMMHEREICAFGCRNAICLWRRAAAVWSLNRSFFLLRGFGFTAGVRDLLCCRTIWSVPMILSLMCLWRPFNMCRLHPYLS